MLHELQPTDHEARFRYSQRFKSFVRNNIRVMDYTFFSDEACSTEAAM